MKKTVEFEVVTGTVVAREAESGAYVAAGSPTATAKGVKDMLDRMLDSEEKSAKKES